MRNVKIGQVYKHFKGNCYIIENLAIDSDTLKFIVVYRALYGCNDVWTKKLSNFLEELPKEKQIEFGQIYKYEKIDKY
jgi:hypothetical protein